MKHERTVKAMTATALAMLLLAFAPTSMAAEISDHCEATQDAPSCDFLCRQGTIIEMVVYGPGVTDENGTEVAMTVVCGGAGPVPNSGYVKAQTFGCQVSEDPLDPVWDAVQPECTSHMTSTFDGSGTCILDKGSRATCRVVLPP